MTFNNNNTNKTNDITESTSSPRKFVKKHKSNYIDDSSLAEFYIDASVSSNLKRAIHAIVDKDGKPCRIIVRDSIAGEKINSMLSELKTLKYLIEYLLEETNIRKIKVYSDNAMVVKKYIQGRDIKDQIFNRKLKEIKNYARAKNIFLKIVYIVREKNHADFYTKFENINGFALIKSEYNNHKKTYSSKPLDNIEEIKKQYVSLEEKINSILISEKVESIEKLREKLNNISQTLSDFASLKKYIDLNKK